jgi:hypothetical protein
MERAVQAQNTIYVYSLFIPQLSRITLMTQRPEWLPPLSSCLLNPDEVLCGITTPYQEGLK